ncbi:MAG: antA/AntB antirepressor family protein [Gammaproteobacteria bacterium]|nr:antA/AntB antirepressor family protein [Gammaproteobacteria bacterium]
MKLSETQLDQMITLWHDDKSILCELHEFLGLSKEDYSKWVKTPSFQPESDLDEDEVNFILSMKGRC